MASRPWHLLSLCDGYGGTELALRQVARVRTVCRVERDSYAAAILVERMDQARLDPCPIWDEIETFDGRPWSGRVDIVAAGFPCPDFSAAGRRAGVDGEHWLWPECFEIIRDVGPRVVLLENVPGIVRLGGLTRVLSDLADVGFDAEWGCLGAGDVGAPHLRERWWCVAVADPDRDGFGRVGQPQIAVGSDVDRCDGANVGDPGGTRRREDTGSTPRDESSDGWQPDRSHQSAGAGEDVADATRPRWGVRGDGGFEWRVPTHLETGGADDVADTDRVDGRPGHRPGPGQRTGRVADIEERGVQVADTERERSQGAGQTGSEIVVAAGHGGLWPPRRDDRDGWVEWINAGGPQPVVRRLSDGPPDGLADALRLGGNGIVPQCAAAAWGALLARGGWTLDQ